jgi:hypothetical protein
MIGDRHLKTTRVSTNYETRPDTNSAHQNGIGRAHGRYGAFHRIPGGCASEGRSVELPHYALSLATQCGWHAEVQYPARGRRRNGDVYFSMDLSRATANAWV